VVKRWGIGFALVMAVLLIINAVMAWRAERRLEGKRTALRAAGLPASIADLTPKPIDDESNAAIEIERIKPRLDAFSREYNAFYQSELGKMWSPREEAGQPPTPEQAAAIRTILEAYPDILTAFKRAAGRSAYASRLDFTLSHSDFLQSLMNRQSDVRMLARFADWHARLLIASDRVNEAALLGINELKLARLYENEPTLVNYLVSIAVRGHAIDGISRAIRAGSITDETRGELLAELDAQDRPTIKNALDTEFATVLDYPTETTFRVPTFLAWPIKNWMLSELAAVEVALEAADRPYYEIRDKWGERPTTQPGSQLLLPAMQAAFQAEARRLALLRCLRILVALEAYRLRTGHDASGLEDLALPDKAVIDPHSGKPLKLKHTEQGWIVYSVMENGVDDGGDFTDLKDWGLAPPKLVDAPQREE
jgi:hypothetical protein